MFHSHIVYAIDLWTVDFYLFNIWEQLVSRVEIKV